MDFPNNDNAITHDMDSSVDFGPIETEDHEKSDEI